VRPRRTASLSDVGPAPRPPPGRIVFPIIPIGPVVLGSPAMYPGWLGRKTGVKQSIFCAINAQKSHRNLTTVSRTSHF
jgi:hypothetical protein